VIYVVFLVNSFLQLGYKKRIILNVVFFSVFTFFLISNIQKTDESRNRLWSVTWEAIKKKPLFGYGMGQSDRILHSQGSFAQEGIYTPVELNHSHNQFLTFLLEIGVVGVIVLLGGFVFFMFRTRRHRDQVLVLFLFGLGYISLTESILQTSKPLYVLCFLFLILSERDDRTVIMNKKGRLP